MSQDHTTALQPGQQSKSLPQKTAETSLVPDVSTSLTRDSSVPVLCGPPPAVENASLIGARKAKYNVHATVRYQCDEGFAQHHVATIRCRSNGKWDRPQIVCTKRRYFLPETSAQVFVISSFQLKRPITPHTDLA